MILLVGCSVIEGDKPTFAKGAASALVEEKLAEDLESYEKKLIPEELRSAAKAAQLEYNLRSIISMERLYPVDEEDLDKFEPVIAQCEAIAFYLEGQDARGEMTSLVKISVTPTPHPTPQPTPVGYPRATDIEELAKYFRGVGGIPSHVEIDERKDRFLEPFVIEGLVEEYVGDGVWRVELKGNFLEIYEKHGDPSDFEPYVWEVYEPLGNIRRISKEFREYC